ncbi:MAG: hypothetical protein WAU15_06455, partial [Nitrosomonas sp.]
LYTQSHIGLYIFHPDNRTRSVFLAAKAEFDKAAELGLISPSFKDLSLYNSNTHEDEEITVDQVKAIQWLIALSNNDPSILKQVKRNLDIFFTWSYLSDKSFPIYNGILVEARKKHHELLNTVDKFKYNILELKGAYDLGWGMAVWTQLLTAFRTYSPNPRKSSPDHIKMIKEIGGRILQYLELLSIEITPREHSHLQLQNSIVRDIVTLNARIENQLRIKRGTIYGQIYALSYSQTCVLTIFQDPASEDLSWQKLMPTFEKIANELGVESTLKQKASLLQQKTLSSKMTDEVVDVTNRLFSAIVKSK